MPIGLVSLWPIMPLASCLPIAICVFASLPPCLLSALGAIPETIPWGEGAWPQLRLLPGLYTGNENVFIGGPGDADYPSAARCDIIRSI